MNRSILALLLAVLLGCGDDKPATPAVSTAPAPPPKPPPPTGPEIYTKHCASCHGAQGEGGKDYPEPLVGERTLEKLAVYVRKKMPEDKPNTLTADESMRVSK